MANNYANNSSTLFIYYITNKKRGCGKQPRYAEYCKSSVFTYFLVSLQLPDILIHIRDKQF